MVIDIQISGVRKRLLGLPAKLRKELNKDTGKWMKSVQKSAKLRAPRDTKGLKDSIKLIKQKNGWLLDVQSPYGIYQEEGFRPHWIHTDMIKGNYDHGREGFVWVSGFKPFVGPALKHNLSKLSSTLSKSTKRAIGGR